MSPDGQTIVSGAGDETLRFWNVFGKALSVPVCMLASSVLLIFCFLALDLCLALGTICNALFLQYLVARVHYLHGSHFLSIHPLLSCISLLASLFSLSLSLYLLLSLFSLALYRKTAQH